MRALTTVLLLTACSRSGPPDAPAGPDAAAAAHPTLAVVTADRADLLFRYRTEAGEATAQSIGEIPEAARASVHVVDLGLSPAQRRASAYVQVFDLRQAGPDGRFPGELVPRADLESRLAEAAAKARPTQQKVTLYSASWCGVCTKARAFLTEKGVPFTERDVEKDPAAAKILAAKGMTGSVPVFEIGGRFLKGFDARSLMKAIRGEGS